MKTAIVYATKYGCTKECAEILKTYLHGEVNILSAKADKIIFNRRIWERQR